MTPNELISTLGLPPGAIISQRVSKELLIEHGAKTASDKRRIREGIEELVCRAILKPTTIAVPSYSDELRSYEEIAVMVAALRPGADQSRLTSIIHRAIQYPVLLLARDTNGLTLSVAHKRRSKAEAEVVVVDGEVIAAPPIASSAPAYIGDLLAALPLSAQPQRDLYHLYWGWAAVMIAALAAETTGRFTLTQSPDEAIKRLSALDEYSRIKTEAASLRRAAAGERQLARQVAMNLEIKQLEAALANLYSKL